MDQIVWSEEFNIGVPKIDRQHKTIVNMLNRLLSASGITTDSETVSDLLTEMTRYAQEHFTAEERFLKEHGYPDLEAHKKQHFYYQKHTVELCTETMKGMQAVPDKLLAHLHKWWVHHILIEDMKYKLFVQAKQK